MSKKCTPLWREDARSTYQSQNVKGTTCLDHFWRFRCGFAWRAARDSAPCQKWAKREGFVAFPKTMAGVGHLKSMRALISWEGLHFGASDLQFWEDDFAWQVQHFVWPGTTFSWQAQYFRQVEWKNAKRIGTRPSALHSTFHFWRKPRRIVSFLMLSTSKIEEVSQNSFVFVVIKFKSWGSLADLLRFWRCQVQELRKSRSYYYYSYYYYYY